MFLLLLVIKVVGDKAFKKESLGGGDIKLACVMGIILKIKMGLIALILSSFLALPYAVASLHLKKESEFPYGPFLGGALLIVFYNYDKFVLLFKYLFKF